MAASPQPANALAEAEGGSGAAAAFRPGFSALEPEPLQAGPAPSLHCREPWEGVCEELFLLPPLPPLSVSPSLFLLWVRDDCLLQRGRFPESLKA